MDYLVAPDRVETDAFTIRSYEPGDGARLSEAINSSYEHLRTFMPWARPYQPPEESERRCREWRGYYLQAENFTLGIFSPDGARLLGSTGFHLRNGGLRTRNAEIGMWIRADAAGQGLGTRVLVTLLRWGFDAWPWMRLTWLCDTQNVASARTAEKAGLRREACLRSHEYAIGSTTERHDTFLYAALRGEWVPPESGANAT